MRQIRFLDEASEELEATATYYNYQQPGLGAAFLTEARKTRERIAELPNAARSIRKNIRRRAVHKFPYYILYRVSDDDVLIIAIAHKRRRPGFWRGRI